jgi:hypothetical protein
MVDKVVTTTPEGAPHPEIMTNADQLQFTKRKFVQSLR